MRVLAFRSITVQQSLQFPVQGPSKHMSGLCDGWHYKNTEEQQGQAKHMHVRGT